MLKLTKKEASHLVEFNRGGEAILYRYSNQLLFKRFYQLGKEELNRKKAKVELFEKIPFPKEIVSPKESVEINGVFEGYLMPEVPNADNLYLLTNKKYRKMTGMTNRDILELLIEVGNLLEMAHRNHFILGDLSGYNILLKEKKVYLIDVDSWGICGTNLVPDAYNPLFASPEVYQGEFSKETDYFSFAVLAFNLLTMLHPFQGTYHGACLDPKEAIIQKLSLLGNHGILYPLNFGSWKWMSPDLVKTFLAIFEQEKRIFIKTKLEEELQQMKYCAKHQNFYFGRYLQCPICDCHAQIRNKTIRTVSKIANLLCISEPKDIYMYVNWYCYTKKQGDSLIFVHAMTNRMFQKKLKERKRIDFTEDGKFLLVITDHEITVYNKQEEVHAKFPIKAMNAYCMQKSSLYYIDPNNCLTQVLLKERGNYQKQYGALNTTLFEINEKEEILKVSCYGKRAIIESAGYFVTIKIDCSIQEYAIRYDEVNQNWLFIYRMRNKKARTLVIQKSKILYDSTEIHYQTNPLSNLCFYNNTIYEPLDGKIIGTNFISQNQKEFPCPIAEINSKLNFKNGKLMILTTTKVYQFG